jgi:hypothetical protein
MTLPLPQIPGLECIYVKQLDANIPRVPSSPVMDLGVAELTEDLNVCTEADVDAFRTTIPEYMRDWLKYHFRKNKGPIHLMPLENAPPGCRVIGPAPLYCQACGHRL